MHLKGLNNISDGVKQPVAYLEFLKGG